MRELARRPGPTVRTKVTEFVAGDKRTHEDRLVTEEPLEIRLAWPGTPAHRVWVTMRTPGHDFDLAVGWLVHEGVSREIAEVAYCSDADLRPEQEFNVVTVTLAAAPTGPLAHQHPALSSGSSACGVCGRDTIDSAVSISAVPWSGPRPDPDVVRRLPGLLRDRQTLFSRTGGVHAAGLFTASGQPLVVREDVGRHNAVDKVTGARLLGDESPAEAVLVVSGRAGFELVQKAAAAGIGTLVSVGAPTSLAVDLAGRAGLDLYGFTSAERAVRYT